jgi:stage V sporulation protein S
MIAVGAGAVNQAVKGFAIASGYASPQGMSISMRPGFTEIEIESEVKTGIKFKVIVD